MDLTLTDLIGFVVERRGMEKPRWREPAPLRAFFERKNEIAHGRPTITVLPAVIGREREKIWFGYLHFLQEQFPSMTSIPSSYPEDAFSYPVRFTISDSDYATMKLIFGGQGWS